MKRPQTRRTRIFIKKKDENNLEGFLLCIHFCLLQCLVFGRLLLCFTCLSSSCSSFVIIFRLIRVHHLHPLFLLVLLHFFFSSSSAYSLFFSSSENAIKKVQVRPWGGWRPECARPGLGRRPSPSAGACSGPPWRPRPAKCPSSRAGPWLQSREAQDNGGKKK